MYFCSYSAPSPLPWKSSAISPKLTTGIVGRQRTLFVDLWPYCHPHSHSCLVVTRGIPSEPKWSIYGRPCKKGQPRLVRVRCWITSRSCGQWPCSKLSKTVILLPFLQYHVYAPAPRDLGLVSPEHGSYYIQNPCSIAAVASLLADSTFLGGYQTTGKDPNDIAHGREFFRQYRFFIGTTKRRL